MRLNPHIVLGKYIPGESFIHRIDPKLKLFFLLFLFFLNYFIKTVEAALIILGIILLGLLRARLPASSVLKSLLPFISLFLLTALLNLFFTPGESIAGIGPLGITLEGVRTSAILTFKLTIMILSASLFTLTTTQSGVIRAIEWFLNPLRKTGLPVKEFSLMVSLSMRFIPILFEEADRIFKAQAIKGVPLESFKKRVKALPFFLSPLFTNTFRRADELTNAMIVRGYEEYKTHH